MSQKRTGIDDVDIGPVLAKYGNFCRDSYHIISYHLSYYIISYIISHIDGLVHERRKSIANAVELRLTRTNLSISYHISYQCTMLLRRGYTHWYIPNHLQSCRYICPDLFRIYIYLYISVNESKNTLIHNTTCYIYVEIILKIRRSLADLPTPGKIPYVLI